MLHRARLLVVLSGLLPVIACGGPAPNGQVNGTLSGTVTVTGPTAGVVVSGYELDLETGRRGDVVAQSEPTGPDGAFQLELGKHEGPLMLVARSVGATYTEPASGVSVAWDSTTELRGAYVAWTPNQDLTFGFERAASVADVVMSPWTELAVAYAEGRVRSARSSTYEDALEDAHLLLRDHLSFDYWSVVPADLTSDPAGGWNDAVQAGVELAGLSELVRRAAVDSQISPAGLTTLQLLALLRRDLGDHGAQLDGHDDGGALALGTCGSVCALGPRTLRAHFAEAIASFLGSAANTSGIGVTDADALMQHLACPPLTELFPSTGSCDFDSLPPEIRIEDLADAEILSGTVNATVTVVDAVAMGGVQVRFARLGEPVETPALYTANTTMPNAQTAVVALSIQTAALNDGPVTLAIDAEDASGNTSTTTLSLFFDNAPAGHVAGTVVLGGRVAAARIRAFEYEGGIQGSLVGEAVTNENGVYLLEVTASTTTSLLLQADNVPGEPAASYIEGTSGGTVSFSTGDVFETVLTAWIDGAERSDGMITPWTHVGASFARAIFEGSYGSIPASWDLAVDDAFGLLDEHFTEGGVVLDVRAVPPADLTSVDGTSFLNAQVRYGLMNAALGQLADTHADASGTTPAAMNTLTLTKLLARDVGEDGSGLPLLDGRIGSGPLFHGTVGLDSYVTRVDLAIAAVAFLETNPNNATPFVELDVAALLDHISIDDNLPPYPAAEPPRPYDVVAPGPVAFVAPTPGEGAVVQGLVALRAEASDNRALATLGWAAPTVGSSLVDTSAGRPGPWVLTGTLDTSALGEGPVVVTARATDEAARSTDASRLLIVDRTPPSVVIGSAATPAGIPVASGGWTGSPMIAISGAIQDPHLSSASYRWNGGPSTPLSLGADGGWAVSLPLGAGANTIAVTATDQAGSSAGASATYQRDATPPSVTVVANSLQNESALTASIAGTGLGTVTYGGTMPTVALVPSPVPSFSKFASRYGPAAPNLPVWRFQVGDNRSTPDKVALQARLLRQAGGSFTVVREWVAVPAVAGAGYNRQQAISSDLASDVAVKSGTYRLEYAATDELGNVSAVASVDWVQTLRPPPVRQRAGSACSGTDTQCPSYYGLDGSHNNASVAIRGGSLPENKLKIANAFIDNPNAVPVRVRLTGTPGGTYSRSHVYQHPILELHDSTFDYPAGCMAKPKTVPSGGCFTPGSTMPVTTSGTPALATTYKVTLGTVALLPCADCTANEFEIPPSQTITVWVMSGPMSFLQAGFGGDVLENGPIGVDVAYAPDPLPATTGLLEETWAKCDSAGASESTFSTCWGAWTTRREAHLLTSITVTPSFTVSLTSRPASSADVLSPATGTGVSGLVYAVSPWSTRETGY